MKKYQEVFWTITIIISTLSWSIFIHHLIKASQDGSLELKNNISSEEFLQNVVDDLLNKDRVNYSNFVVATDKIKEQKELARIEEEKRKLELEKQKQLEEINKYETYSMRISHYSSNCVGCGGISKSGVDIRSITKYKGYHIIATDPKVIPLWSIVELELPTRKVKAIVLDVGGAIKNNRIDFLVGSTKEAYKLGVYRDVKVTVIRKGKG